LAPLYNTLAKHSNVIFSNCSALSAPFIVVNWILSKNLPTWILTTFGPPPAMVSPAFFSDVLFFFFLFIYIYRKVLIDIIVDFLVLKRNKGIIIK